MRQRNTFDANSIFSNSFLDGKALYMFNFNKIPSSNYMGSIDGEKSFHAIREKFARQVKSVHQYRYFDSQVKKYSFGETHLVMKNNCILEFDDDYCEIYHDGSEEQFIAECSGIMRTFMQRSRRKPLEINLITQTKQGLSLKGMEIKRTKLDIALFYEDDFAAIDSVICKRLNKQNDKGIVLLHGLPGTGKTTYLRHLVGKIKKRVMFVSPAIAGNIMDPDFIQLLIDHPNTVLVIEDAENIIMDRKISGNASVSNLLNISDGLLADFLNVQLICTFNSPLTMVDSALMRQGRLIAKYEFGKLSTRKAQRLSDHFGFNNAIDRPMTIAEIAHQHETITQPEHLPVIGFRRTAIQMN
ncbi:MAG: ATPase [Ferruginibacter sp.]|nr:ATPase [Ferruginibacter sp.]